MQLRTEALLDAREGVAHGASPRELLNVSKISNSDSLLLASNETTSGVLAGVDFSVCGQQSLRRTSKRRPRTGDTLEDP